MAFVSTYEFQVLNYTDFVIVILVAEKKRSQLEKKIVLLRYIKHHNITMIGFAKASLLEG